MALLLKLKVSRILPNKKASAKLAEAFLSLKWRGMDLNHGPSGYEPDELPDCSTPRRLMQYSLHFAEDYFYFDFVIQRD